MFVLKQKADIYRKKLKNIYLKYTKNLIMKNEAAESKKSCCLIVFFGRLEAGIIY